MNRPHAVRALAARPITGLAALVALAALANALVVGCGGKSGETQNPPAAEDQAPPGGTSSATADLGAKVYADRCALCHGASGHGDGPAAAGLNPKPRNHTDGAYMNSRSNEELLDLIRKGKGAMPPWESVLSDEEIHAVLGYVRSLASPPYEGSLP